MCKFFKFIDRIVIPLATFHRMHGLNICQEAFDRLIAVECMKNTEMSKFNIFIV